MLGTSLRKRLLAWWQRLTRGDTAADESRGHQAQASDDDDTRGGAMAERLTIRDPQERDAVRVYLEEQLADVIFLKSRAIGADRARLDGALDQLLATRRALCEPNEETKPRKTP